MKTYKPGNPSPEAEEIFRKVRMWLDERPSDDDVILTVLYRNVLNSGQLPEETLCDVELMTSYLFRMLMILEHIVNGHAYIDEIKIDENGFPHAHVVPTDEGEEMGIGLQLKNMSRGNQ